MASAHTIILASGLAVPVVQYNSTINGKGFYVSFNDHDMWIYGCDTTALVRDQMDGFYILNGDHRAAYTALIPQGFEACLEYFKSNNLIANKLSDHPPQAVQA
ncbi:hypothetical protein QO021_30255 (plasmid) [Pseudomonas amygdali pv. lachrymans]|uniref:hypothetical protein n=1 Tax=Pseudomonas amygdali TaxID=47877 RepID=UPI0006B941DA|nr:hypothetical protein [Pseudomonas amygdali]KPC02037.1 Uncharacterized protein AC501_3323 [Pseudomonas amygdali pv. lachrymans]RMM39429.1 hypothetical protein ALQ79_200737 [Pseudomonas amygdali pv. lachrymans]WIO61371.1 hypothetical protein QO021_30255 [Pseudomonas amygdali pv. lachrymans]